MRYNGTEKVTLFRAAYPEAGCEFEGGRGRMARQDLDLGLELAPNNGQWSMGWQRTAQRIGNTGVPCGGQMLKWKAWRVLEGSPSQARLPVFARPAKKLASPSRRYLPRGSLSFLPP